MSDNFSLSDAQWAAIAPLLPMVHTGPVRQDDRRIISGILHRLREGCRRRALPAEYGSCPRWWCRSARWLQVSGGSGRLLSGGHGGQLDEGIVAQRCDGFQG